MCFLRRCCHNLEGEISRLGAGYATIIKSGVSFRPLGSSTMARERHVELSSTPTSLAALMTRSSPTIEAQVNKR